MAAFSLPHALKDAGLAALVMAGLTIPLVGLRITDVSRGLAIETHLNWVLTATTIVFVGRFLLNLLAAQNLGQRLARHTVNSQTADALWWWTTLVFAVLGIGFALALPLLPFADRYVVDLATTVLIYIMLGWGLNIVVGLAGLLDLGYVAFYAVGAYSYALLSLNFGLSFWLCLPLAGLFAALFGIALGIPVLRLRGDYLAIVTLGFGEIIRVVLINWQEVTGGPNGISGIERPSFFGLPFTRNPAEGDIAFHQFFELSFSPLHRIIFLYYLILVLALVTNFFTLRIRRLPIGRAWEAIREDEIACRSLGIDPTTTKLTAFAIGAMFAGFAGSFFATRQGFISPESFTFHESAVIVAIVVLGGMGSQIGVVFAALLLVLLPELGRDFAQYRMLLFGAAMVLIMIWRPRGLLSHRDPTIRYPKSRPPKADLPTATPEAAP